MTPRPLPPAPEWYRLEVVAADPFRFGQPPPLPAEVLALAYRVGVRPGSKLVATAGRAWLIEVRRGRGADRYAYGVDVHFDLAAMPEHVRAWRVAELGAALIERAGEPDRVRELLGDPEYLTGRAAIRYVEVGRGWCSAYIDRAGRRMVRVEVAGAENREPADLDALAWIVDLVEPRSERLERWRERGDS